MKTTITLQNIEDYNGKIMVLIHTEDIDIQFPMSYDLIVSTKNQAMTVLNSWLTSFFANISEQEIKIAEFNARHDKPEIELDSPKEPFIKRFRSYLTS